MRLGIYTNRSKDEKLQKAEALAGECAAKGFDYRILSDMSNLEGLDILVVIGGDGTILNICGDAAIAGVPILSVNNGRMGFLTEIELFEFSAALENISAGKFETEERMMMDVVIDGKTFVSLNEILVVREKRNSISRIDVRCGGELIDTYEGDGVIVSTPTGSTGYSLSSGGPILSPKIKAFVLTPLCVHSLVNRPWVFSDAESLEIEVQSRDDDNSAYIDGREVAVNLKKGAKIIVRKSELTVNFVRVGKQSFYGKMYRKLVQWNNFKKG